MQKATLQSKQIDSNFKTDFNFILIEFLENYNFLITSIKNE